jgi:hypothetical protein
MVDVLDCTGRQSSRADISVDVAAQEALRMIFRRRKVRIEIEHTSLRVETTTESCEPLPANLHDTAPAGSHRSAMDTPRPLTIIAKIPAKDESRQ